jgi:hypothetical protein
MSDKWEPTIEPTPCVDKNGVFITKGMKVLYTSTDHKPPYSKVVQEGTTISDPVFMRNIWGEHYWIVNIKGNGWSATGPRVHEIEAVTAERLSKGPTDVELERAAIAAWLRSEPETVKECSGHRHKDGKKCLIITPMTMAEIADAIAKGDYPREKE